MAIAAAIERRLAERLAAHGDVRVHGAADFADLDDRKRRTSGTAVYVLPLEERSPATPALGDAGGVVDASFGVVLRHANRRDARGGAAVQDLAELRGRARSALAGWTPEGAALPMTFRAGRLLDAGDGEVWWQDDFETRYQFAA